MGTFIFYIVKLVALYVRVSVLGDKKLFALSWLALKDIWMKLTGIFSFTYPNRDASIIDGSGGMAEVERFHE
jgi:hypothetical protein